MLSAVIPSVLSYSHCFFLEISHVGEIRSCETNFSISSYKSQAGRLIFSAISTNECSPSQKLRRFIIVFTSLDDLDNVVTPKGLDGGYWALRRALELIEKNRFYKTKFFCEPQMSKRGLYPGLSLKNKSKQVREIMNILSFCDGEHSLLDIAEKINVPAWQLYETVEKLIAEDLISPI